MGWRSEGKQTKATEIEIRKQSLKVKIKAGKQRHQPRPLRTPDRTS